MDINLFETFAGVGSQHTALKNISSKNDSIRLAGISEWDMYAVLAYYKMNGYTFNPQFSQKLSDEEIRNHFKERPYSLDSKKISERIHKSSIGELRKLYEAENKLKNIPDINTLTGKDIIERKVNLLTYSFPCQDLSTAGKGMGMSKDSGTRSGLLWQIERVLDEIVELNRDFLPKYLLMENVNAIINKNNKPDYDLWKQKLNELGYTSYDGTLNAMDFGIPQSRKRFFCISILDPKIKREENDINKILDEYKIQTKPLSDFLRIDYEKDSQKKEADLAVPNHTHSRIGMFEREKTICKIVNKPSLDEKKINKYKVVKEYISTLTTKQDRWNNGGMLEYYECKFNHKQQQKDVSIPRNGFSKFRFLTNREAFLLMGFKEEQIEKVLSENISKERLYRQAGNSIVVNVLEAIFKEFVQREEN